MASRPGIQLTSDGRPVCQCRTLVPGKMIRGRTVENTLQRGGRPVLIATFRGGELVSIERQHYAGRDNCRVPAEILDPKEWIRS